MSLTSICSTSLSSLFCPLYWSFFIFRSVFSCHCLFLISNKNQTFNPIISASPPYSGLKTLHIVIYITKIKHWIEISRFSKLEFRGSKFCGWPKNFRNSRNEISGLAKNLDIHGDLFSRFSKKFAKPRNFLPAKISDNKVNS